MSRTVTGRLYKADGTAIISTSLRLVARRHSFNATDGAVPLRVQVDVAVDSLGDFSVVVNIGEYDVRLLTDDDTWYSIGHIVVNSGDTTQITLGELIDLSRTATFDALDAGDWATRAWVLSNYPDGTAPENIPITSLGVGTLADGEMVVRQGASLAAAPWYVVNPANNFEAESGGTYAITAGNTLQLPATPSNGMWIRILPWTSWETTSSTLGDGTDTINGSTQTMTLDIDCVVYVAYVGGTTGWSLLQSL